MLSQGSAFCKLQDAPADITTQMREVWMQSVGSAPEIQVVRKEDSLFVFISLSNLQR